QALLGKAHNQPCGNARNFGLCRLARARKNSGHCDLDSPILWSQAKNGCQGRLYRVFADGRPKRVHSDARACVLQADVWRAWQGEIFHIVHIHVKTCNQKWRRKKTGSAKKTLASQELQEDMQARYAVQ